MKTLLLGYGYTLEKVATLLPSGTCLATTRSQSKAELLEANGIQGEVVDLTVPNSLEMVLERNPDISTIVDSVPVEGGFRHAPLVATALKERQDIHLVYLSTTGVYGGREGEWVSEDSPRNPRDPRAEARCAEEDAYLTSLPLVTVMRISGIYGPGRNMLTSLRQNRYPRVEGNRWSNRIHVEDLARAIAEVVKGRVTGVFNVSDDNPSPIEEVLSFACDLLGFELPSAISQEDARERGMFTLLSNQRVDNSALKERLRISLFYPSYREGLLALTQHLS